jgi:hypothetical protein
LCPDLCLPFSGIWLLARWIWRDCDSDLGARFIRTECSFPPWNEVNRSREQLPLTHCTPYAIIGIAPVFYGSEPVVVVHRRGARLYCRPMSEGGVQCSKSHRLQIQPETWNAGCSCFDSTSAASAWATQFTLNFSRGLRRLREGEMVIFGQSSGIISTILF